MNICFIPFDYPTSTSGGGVGTTTQLLARELRRSGAAVSVIAMGTQDDVLDEEEGFQVHRLKPGNWHWYVSRLPLLGRHIALPIRELEYSWAAFAGVLKLRKRQHVNVVECTETGAVFLAIFLRRLLLIRLHGDRYTFQRRTPGMHVTTGVRLTRVLQRIALRRARLLVSPSRWHADEIATELGKKHAPIAVVSHGLPTAALPRDREEDVEPAQTPRTTVRQVLFAGRLEVTKGILVLIEAAREVVSQYPGVQFVLAGANHPSLSKETIETLIEKYSLGNAVRLCGHVPKSKLRQLYGVSDIVVLPSYYETFGMSALEPMAYGLPVVASRAGALPEVVEDGVTGLLVEPGSATELASAILRLLNDPALRARMGKAARDRVDRHYRLEQHITTNLDLFQRLTTAA